MIDSNDLAVLTADIDDGADGSVGMEGTQGMTGDFALVQARKGDCMAAVAGGADRADFFEIQTQPAAQALHDCRGRLFGARKYADDLAAQDLMILKDDRLGSQRADITAGVKHLFPMFSLKQPCS